MGTPVPNSRVENAQPLAGEVVTYRLSPEEVAARYGPPTDPRKARQIRNWQRAIRGARKQEEVLEVTENVPENMPENMPIKTGQGLTQEAYCAMKAQGKLDRDIMQECGLSVKQLHELKRKWGIVPDADKKAATGPQNAGQVKNYSSENISRDKPLAPREKAISIDGVDGIEWAAPFVKANSEPILKVQDWGLSLNVVACRQIKAVKIRVGVGAGRVVILPADDDTEGCFKIGRSKNGSAKVGGEALARFLLDRGVQPGKYRLAKNDQAGWWEART